MKTHFLFAATLFALSCAACHSEETRKKIEKLEAERTAQGAPQSGPHENSESAEEAANSAD